MAEKFTTFTNINDLITLEEVAEGLGANFVVIREGAPKPVINFVHGSPNGFTPATREEVAMWEEKLGYKLPRGIAYNVTRKMVGLPPLSEEQS